MGTLGGRARRLAKRQQYEATHEEVSTAASSQTNRLTVRVKEATGGKVVKGNASFVNVN